MNRMIQDNDEARLFIDCAGALKRLDEATDGAGKPKVATAFWAAGGEFCLGARYAGFSKTEDNGYAVYVFDDLTECKKWAARHFADVPAVSFEMPDFG